MNKTVIDLRLAELSKQEQNLKFEDFAEVYW